jgi:predicted RNase H-like HicB family nuclease
LSGYSRAPPARGARRILPGAISQGRTRAEARENVIDALRLMLRPDPGEETNPDHEALELQLTA